MKKYNITFLFILGFLLAFNTAFKENPVSLEKTNLSVNNDLLIASIVGPEIVTAGEVNQWYAGVGIIQSPNDEPDTYQWYIRTEGQGWWTPINGATSRNYSTALMIDPPIYSINYELRVDIVTKGNQSLTATIIVNSTYDPGWSGCEYIGGPQCPRGF